MVKVCVKRFLGVVMLLKRVDGILPGSMNDLFGVAIYIKVCLEKEMPFRRPMKYITILITKLNIKG